MPVPKVIDGWDYGTDLVLEREIVLDQAEVRRDCGLPSDAPLGFTIVWWPDTSLLRTAEPTQDITEPGGAAGSSLVTLRCNIPGSLAGGMLKIDTALVLQDACDAGEWVAAVAGSELWSDQQATRLEGQGPLFPMQVGDPAAWGCDPSAPWVLVTPDSLTNAAMGSVVLILNERFTDMIAVLLGEPTPVRSSVESCLRADVGSTLLDIALSRLEDLEDDSHPEGTFGWVLFNHARNAFGEAGLRPAADLRNGDPSAYRARLNGFFGLMGDITQ